MHSSLLAAVYIHSPSHHSASVIAHPSGGINTQTTIKNDICLIRKSEWITGYNPTQLYMRANSKSVVLLIRTLMGLRHSNYAVMLVVRTHTNPNGIVCSRRCSPSSVASTDEENNPNAHQLGKILCIKIHIKIHIKIVDSALATYRRQTASTNRYACIAFHCPLSSVSLGPLLLEAWDKHPNYTHGDRTNGSNP